MELPSTAHRRTSPRDGRAAAVTAGALLAALLAAAPGAARASGGGGEIAPLPPSLAALYPPAAKEPVHLFAMLGLQDAFAGIVVDLLEDDAAGARAAFALFEERYRAAAALVPEWRAAYPEAPVRELGAALAGGDRGRTMGAYEAVGAVCHGCHLSAMVPVQQRHRWGRFGAREIRDPLAGDITPYPVFKRRLAAALSGVGWDVRQGQLENARLQLRGFTARFAALRDTCVACHATPRRAYVDTEVQRLVEELGAVLARPAVDPAAVGDLIGRIGQSSCSGCHLVHVPAATAQALAAEAGR